MARTDPMFLKVRNALPDARTDGFERPDSMILTIKEAMSSLTDTRYQPNCRHIFAEVLAMAFFAILSGADEWTEVESYCEAREAYLGKWLSLPGGIPSHDTFQRCFMIVRREELMPTMTSVVCSIVNKAYQRIEGKAFLSDDTPVTDIIAIDGKAMLGSARAMTYAGEVRKLQMLNAWSTQFGLCLWSEPIPDKTNEIPVSQELCRKLDVRGTVVTGDALNTQTELAKAIVGNGGHYCLALKANRPRMLGDVALYFAEPEFLAEIRRSGRSCQSVNRSNSCVWTRTYYSTPEVGWQAESPDWNGLRSFGMVERKREDLRTGEVSTERAYYLLSFDDVGLFALAARSHWGVENNLHWQLDATFSDDANQTAEKESAAALSLMKRFVLSLISIVKDCYKGLSMKRIRKTIGWGNGEDEFLTNLAKSGHLV